MNSAFGDGYLIKGNNIVSFPPKTEHHVYIRERPDLLGMEQSQWLQEVPERDLFEFLFSKGWVRVRKHEGVLNTQGEKKTAVRAAVESFVMSNGMPSRVTVEWLGVYSELNGEEQIADFINRGRIPMRNPPMIDEDEDQNGFGDVGCGSAVDAEAMLAAAQEREEYAIAANPKLLAQDVYADIMNNGPDGITAKNLGLAEVDMLGAKSKKLGGSAKLGKSMRYSFWTPGLYLASGDVAGFEDLCMFASQGCRKNCLLVSGQRAQDKKTALEVIERLRAGRGVGVQVNVALLKTYLYMFNYPEFMELLHESIVKHSNFAAKNSFELAIRLNATSDVSWEEDKHGYSIVRDFSDIQFYDYTKNPYRAIKFGTDPAWPDNYYLTFSYSEVNLAWAMIMLRLGVSITVPFNGSLGEEFYKKDKRGYKHNRTILPTHFLGRRVVDGDLFDMRFLEQRGYWEQLGFGPPPYVVGLRVKGNYQKKHASENSFFFDARSAQEHGDNEMFILDQLGQNSSECVRQGSILPDGEYLSMLSSREREAIARARG